MFLTAGLSFSRGKGEKLGDTSALENPASLDEIQRAAG
jgi:hypothetical protein